MKRLTQILISITLLVSSPYLLAQQSQDFGQYVVHYNALNTNLIPPQVAQAYGIQRSSSRALLNITVLRKVMDNPGTPVHASVKAGAVNLTGQRRDLTMREISDSEGSVYYIAEMPVHNMEMFDYTVEVTPEGESDPLVVKFRHQFYTE